MDFLNVTLKKASSKSTLDDFDGSQDELNTQDADMSQPLDDDVSRIEQTGRLNHPDEIEPSLVIVPHPVVAHATSNAQSAGTSTRQNAQDTPTFSKPKDNPEHNRSSRLQREKRKREEQESLSQIQLMDAVAQSLMTGDFMKTADDNFAAVINDYFKRIPTAIEKD